MRIDPGFAARLLEGAIRSGADLAEVYMKSSNNVEVGVREQKVDSAESSMDFGYSLRVIKDRRLGFSFSTLTEDADRVIENALEASSWVEQDDYLDLPSPHEHRAVLVYDDAVALLGQEAAAERALLIEKAALDSDPRIKKVRKASASFSSMDVLIMNSKGLEKSYSATSCAGQITVVAEDGGDNQSGWDFDGSRFLRNLSFEDVGRNAARRALQLLGARNMDRAKACVILDNSVAVDFLGIFASLLSSEAVQKGKSLLAKRMNEEVISPLVSIVDDGCIEGRLDSRPFDDEGVPASRKYLIQDGMLRGYMYNTYTANKDGLVSTGNAVRGGFMTLPAVGPLNLSVEVSPSHVRHGDLFSLVDKGLYVTDAMGIHTANPVSGEYSIGVTGLWIESGNVKKAVKEAVISGNILDFFRKVEAAGDDVRSYGKMASPSLVIGPTDISA
jgi:PmbA protein